MKSTNLFFTGAGGTGKTTTGDLLAPRIGFDRAESASRKSPHPVGTPEHQNYLADAIYDQAAELKHTIIDRTPFDVVGYDTAFGSPTIEKSRWHANFFVQLKPTVVYFPRYWEAEDDGFRPTDTELLDTVDKSIKRQLDFSGLGYYTVLNESPEDRVEHILEFLKERGWRTCQSMYTKIF